jgi:hypothetical protein
MNFELLQTYTGVIYYLNNTFTIVNNSKIGLKTIILIVRNIQKRRKIAVYYLMCLKKSFPQSDTIIKNLDKIFFGKF